MQHFYQQAAAAHECQAVQASVRELSAFLDPAAAAWTTPLSEARAKTVVNPAPRPGGVVGDLAVDRLILLRRQRAACFAPGLVEYQRVQDLYARLEDLTDCPAVRSGRRQLLRFYSLAARLVPEDKAYSVRYPEVRYFRTDLPPTIADLARDRNLRLAESQARCFTAETRKGEQEYTRIQSVYNQAEDSNDCAFVLRTVVRIKTFGDSTNPVPDPWVYTVRYPKLVARPTIRDLVRDRVLRLRESKAQCFDAKLDPFA